MHALALVSIYILFNVKKYISMIFFRSFQQKLFYYSGFGALYLLVHKRCDFGACTNVAQRQKLHKYEFFQNSSTEGFFHTSLCDAL